MNKLLLSLLTLLAVTSANAQLSNTMRYEEDNASKGFRFSLFKPVMDVHSKVTARAMGMSNSESSKDSVDNMLGFSFGYANLPVSQIGYTGQLSLIQVKGGSNGEEERTKADVMRFEGNAAWAFTNQFYMKGGLNFSDITSSNHELIEDLKGGIGIQAGVGFQITQNIGVDLSYVTMNFSDDLTLESEGIPVDVDLEMGFRGLEIGLTGTF